MCNGSLSTDGRIYNILRLSCTEYQQLGQISCNNILNIILDSLRKACIIFTSVFCMNDANDEKYERCKNNNVTAAANAYKSRAHQSNITQNRLAPK